MAIHRRAASPDHRPGPVRAGDRDQAGARRPRSFPRPQAKARSLWSFEMRLLRLRHGRQGYEERAPAHPVHPNEGTDLDSIERIVFDGLKANLTTPGLIAAYVETYNEERKRLAAGLIANRSRIEKRLARVRREFDRMFQSYVKGFSEEAEVSEPLAELRAERKRLEADLANAEKPSESIALHPTALARYRQQIEDLQNFCHPMARPKTGRRSSRCANWLPPLSFSRLPRAPRSRLRCAEDLPPLSDMRSFRQPECGGERW
jgi:hypothetical protein